MSFSAAASVAARQHGVLTLKQLRDAGLSRSQIATLVDRSFLERCGNCVFVVTASPATWRRRVAVGCSHAGPHAVASHRSAAALWSLDGFRPGMVEVMVRRGRRHVVTGVRIHEANHLPDHHLGVIDGIPVTSPARTVVDMARFLAPRRLGALADDAVRRRLSSYRELLAVHLELPVRGRRRSRRAGSMLAHRPGGSGVSGSPLEDIVFELLVKAGLPAPQRQLRIDIPDDVLRVDMAWAESRVAIECDGYQFHGSPTARSRDDARRNQLQAQGWRVLAVTWTMAKESPDQVVEQAGRLLFRRSFGVDDGSLPDRSSSDAWKMFG